MLLKSNYWRFKKGFRNLLQTFDCCGQQWFSPTGLTVGTWTFSLIDWMVWSQQSAQLALKSFLLTTIKQNWMEKKVSKLSFFGPHFRVLNGMKDPSQGNEGRTGAFFRHYHSSHREIFPFLSEYQYFNIVDNNDW